MSTTIKLQDLAAAMSKNAKELLFELQSIGVKVATVDDVLPQEVVEALLSGKPMNAPRQVIVREDGSRERKGKRALKTKIPKVKLVTQKEIPIIDIPKKADIPDEVESVPEEVVEVAAGTEVEKKAKKETVKEAKPETGKKTPEKKVEARPVKKVVKIPPKTAEKPSRFARPQEIMTRKVAEKAAVKTKDGKPEKGKPAKAAAAPKARSVEVKKTTTAPLTETKKVGRKRPERRKTKTATEPTAARQMDVRKFVGSSAEAARKLQEAEEQRSALMRARRKKADEKEQEIHVPLTLDEQVARLKSLISDELEVTLTEGAILRDLIDKLGVKVKDFMPYLFKKGIILAVNQPVSESFVKQLGEDLGFTYKTQTFEEKVADDGESRKKKKEGDFRAPVVTIMGHVDHGKTSILDYIRKASIAAGEAGGITQHIGAYQVIKNERKIVFVDTPGHEAFTQMRARGSRVTDIVILVVAADDGIMPQTVEAINHTRAADVPMIVAINKIDKANADVDRVKKQLSERELLVEDWGGEVIAVPLSAVTGEGIDNLLEMILLVAEMQELKADFSIPAKGTVLEVRKEAGRGIVATVLVQEGTLSQSKYFICGSTYGKIRAMYDDQGNMIKRAEPSTPVEIIGFNDLPSPGDLFQVVANEKEAKRIAELRLQNIKEDQVRKAPVSLEDFFSTVQGREKKTLKFIIKADVTGTLEVVKSVVQNKAIEDVDVRVMHEGAGTITVNDVSLAHASDAVIVGFNVKPERKAQREAELQGVQIRLYTVIYDLAEDVEAAIEGAVVPESREEILGTAEVLKVIKIPKTGAIAGSQVTNGVIKRGAQIRIIRDDTVVRTARVESLKRFTEDVNEVKKGFECGIKLDRSKDVLTGDILECFERRVVEK